MARLPSKLPTADDLGALPSARSGRQIATVDTTAVGRGIADMGKGISQFGAALDANQDRDAELTAERHLIEFENQQIARLDNERRTLTGDPAGFAGRYRSSYDEGARELFARVRESGASPRVLQRLDIGLQRRGANLQTRAFDAEYDQRGRYQDEWVEEQLRRLQEQYVNAPDDEARERLREQARIVLEHGARAGMTHGNQRRFREDYLRRFPELDARTAAQSDPLGVFEQLARGDQRITQPSTGELSETALGRLVEQTPRTPGQGPRSPAERLEIARRIQAETAPISQWIRENVRVRGPNDTGLPEDATNLTQLQHDTLVSIGRRIGMDALSENLPLINTGDFSSLVQSRGNLTAMEQPSEPPPAGERPPTGERRSDAPSNSTAAAIASAAGELGIRPEWLAGIIHHETAGSMDPNRRGGMNRDGSGAGSFLGLIQFSPENQRRYGIRPGMTVEEQMPAVVQYFRDRFAQAGMDPGQATLPQLYAAVLAGDPRQTGARDVNGSAESMARRVEQRGQQWWGRHGDDTPATPGPDGRTRVAQRTDSRNDAGPPTGRATLPGDGRNSGLFNDEESEGLMNQAPARRFRDIPLNRKRVLMNELAVGLRPQLHFDLHRQEQAILSGEQPQRDPSGRTALDRAMSPAAPILTTQQLEKWRIRIESAQRQRAATVNVTQLPRAEAEEFVRRLPPEVRSRVERTHDRVVELRNTDPARAVEGGVLRGADRRPITTFGPDGDPIVTGDAETDLVGAPPAAEVAIARRLIRERIPGVTLSRGADGELTVTARAPADALSGTDEAGNPVFTDDPARQGAATREAWRLIIEARLAAQDRLGVPPENRSPITRAEAADLLRVPRNRRPDDAEFQRILKEAADRAAERYGPYAEQAWRSAVGFSRMSNERSEEALGMAYRLARGDRLTAQDMQRYMRIQDLDRERNLWMGSAQSAGRAQALERITGITGEGFDRPTDLDMYGDAGRPAISNVMPVPGAPRRLPAGPNPQAERQFEVPVEEEIEWLRRNPTLWQEFDRDFGPGSAATYLQGEPQQQRRVR